MGRSEWVDGPRPLSSALQSSRVQSRLWCSLVLLGRDHIINLQNHLNHLSCELKLLLLGHDGFEDALFAHICSALVVGIDADEGVLSAHLLFAQLAHIFDGVVARVLGKGQRDLLESVGEGAHSVLLDTADLVGLLGDGDRASELGGATTANDVIVLDHVADDADGVMEAALGLIADSLGATSDHDGDSLGVHAVLDQDDLLARGAVGDLFDAAGSAELLRGDFLEAGDDARTSGDGKELDLDATDPTDGRKAVLHEQMVGLVVEAPLAEDGGGAGVLDAGNHIREVVRLHLLKFLVVGGALDLKTVLGLGLGGLERAGEDAHLGVLNLLGHLGVGELLVKDDTLDEAGVLDGAASLGNDFDQVEVDVATLEVSNVENGLQGQISVVLLARTDDLGAKGGLGASSQLGVIVLEDVELLLDLVDLAHGDLTSLIEAVSDFERVDALLQKFLGLLEDGTSEHNDTSGAVTDLVVLRSGQLSEESGSLMMDLHLLEDGGTIVGDDNLAIRADEHLVHTLGAERGLHEGGDSARGHDVDLVGLKTLDSLLLLLLAEDDERATVLVECKTHVD
mmetsp:Transcript_8220/g.9954  ORF Transcript_8220/g.9954 Transcript_8220/m.9954 type:complete len:568 (-) Transcript_8220:99-1802(-)